VPDPATIASAANGSERRNMEAGMNQNLTICYERLSVDDGGTEGESNSIANQKQLLQEHADRHKLPNITHIWEACDIIEPNPRSLANSGFRGSWFILFYA
jgi:hypothetical protein